MSEDLYQALDVDRAADEKTIRKAFRKKAMKHHPDKGGKREDFEKIQTALTVLMDPERRAQYDQTGKYDEKGPEEHPDQEALMGIAALFDVIFAKNGGALERVDFVKEMRSICQQEIQNQKSSIVATQKMIKRWEQVAERFKIKDPRVMMGLKGKTNGFRQGIAICEKKIKSVERMLEILADASYRVDTAPPGMMTPAQQAESFEDSLMGLLNNARPGGR